MIDVGQKLGGYTILSRIGRGGMGEVFLAEHRRVSRRAAVKVLVPELSQKATVLDRFFNEARATSLIKHPGIVEILDCDVVDDQAFIVMEFLEGESLGGYLHRAGRLGQDLAFLLGVGTAAAEAVAAAHAAGIIHRDLKPDNIYLHLSIADDPTVTVKILDFGIAKLLPKNGTPSHTTTGMLLGTPTYMSPEQCRGAGRVDERSDIYSLGCILYESICGAPPFVREGVGDLIVAHVSETPEPPCVHVSALPPVVNALIVRMLAKKPEHRPQSMEDVRGELHQCARDLGIGIVGPLRPQVAVERPPRIYHALPPSADHGAAMASGSRPAPEGIAAELPPAYTTPYSSAATPREQPFAPGAAPGPRARPVSHPVVRAPSQHSPDTKAEKSTTLSASSSELRRPTMSAPNRLVWLAGIGGAVVVIGVVVVLVGSRGRPSTPNALDFEPAGRVGGAERSGRLPSGEPTATPHVAMPSSQPSETTDIPETVSIDIQGVPARTTVTVDGRSTALPVQLDRSPQLHRIVLRPPGGAPERELKVDGTKDRIIDLEFDQGAPSSAASRESNRQRPSLGTETRQRPPGSPPEPVRGPQKEPVHRWTEREAITDI